MIDANYNRAREALRVMEDAARFALDDAELCAELKGIRHGLREALASAGVSRDLLVENRDTAGDVGTAISTPSERQRRDLGDVVGAAGARLTEALRVIEECLKTRVIGPAREASSGPATMDGLRYRAYGVDQRLARALARPTVGQWRLCVLITRAHCRRHPWEEVARRAIAGGADCLQLREKDLGDREMLRRARRLIAIAEEISPARREGQRLRSVPVIVNDRVDITHLSDADGVHLGQEDMPASEIERVTGMGPVVGVSTSNLDEARAAARDGADYCGVGPMFPTGTKEKPRIAGVDYLRQYLADPVLSRVPHLAIGGITPDNVGVLREAGCRGVAVSSAVCGAEDPESVCRALIDGIARADADQA